MNIKALLPTATLTIVKKKSGAAQGVLNHIVANASISDEESLQSVLR
jgi:hypothetical protein